MRLFACVSSHLRKLRLRCCNFHRRTIGLGEQEDVFSSSWRVPGLHVLLCFVFFLVRYSFFLKWGLGVKCHMLKRKCAQTKDNMTSRLSFSTTSRLLFLFNCIFFFYVAQAEIETKQIPTREVACINRNHPHLTSRRGDSHGIS